VILRRLSQLGAQSGERAVFSSVLPVARVAPLDLAGRRTPHQRSGMDVEPCPCGSQWIMSWER
jgi:hypothetical protein